MHLSGLRKEELKTTWACAWRAKSCSDARATTRGFAPCTSHVTLARLLVSRSSPGILEQNAHCVGFWTLALSVILWVLCVFLSEFRHTFKHALCVYNLKFRWVQLVSWFQVVLPTLSVLSLWTSYAFPRPLHCAFRDCCNAFCGRSPICNLMLYHGCFSFIYTLCIRYASFHKFQVPYERRVRRSDRA